MNGFLYRVDLGGVIQRRGVFFAMLFIAFLTLKYIFIVWCVVLVFGGIEFLIGFNKILPIAFTFLIVISYFLTIFGGGLKLLEGLMEHRRSNLDLIVMVPYGAFCFALPFAQAAIYELIAGPLSEHFYREVIIVLNVKSLWALTVLVVVLPFFHWVFRRSK